MGQPLESAHRSAILAMKVGAAVGLATRDLKDAYFVALLRHVGCTADAPATADLFGGDEIAARGYLALVDQGKPTALVAALARNLGAGEPPLRRARLLANALIKLPRLAAAARAACEVAQSLADALGCGLRVREALGHTFERWDGKGLGRKQGEAIPIAMRLVQVADEAQRFHGAVGIDGAVAMLGARAGGALDPTLAGALRADAAALFASLDVPSIWDAAIAAEPGTPDYIDDDRLDVALQAMGAFADLKSSYTRGHSTGVAELAAGAAERLGMSAGAVAEVRRAGYVHDMGRAGVAAGVWEKEGPLDDGEWAAVRKHAGYTEQILARPPLLARLGALGSLDHERLDGTGYHQRPAESLSSSARLLAAADMYQAMRETRPHRRPIPASEVAAVLDGEVAKGRLDRDAVSAVLQTADDRERRGHVARHPGGLSDEEIDVLRLVSRGLSDRQVATEMGLPAAEVSRHLRFAYEKIGVTTRAAAAMFAMRNGLVGPLT